MLKETQHALSPNESAQEPMVTIVVVPRERFSYARTSLESVYANTHVPFRLIYVDGAAHLRPSGATWKGKPERRDFG
jgi:hypothetical protein